MNATRSPRKSTVRTIALTGSQSGLGLAVRQRLEADGLRVIGVDLAGKGAEVAADLSTPAGRQHAVRQVIKLAGGRLDGLVANAGVDSKNAELTMQVNYFGAVEVAEGLRQALAKGESPALVFTVSHAIAISPGIATGAADALLAGKLEKAARSLGRLTPNPYSASKFALARWIRRHAAAPEWAGAGITMNGVCPGPIMTPMLEHDLQDPMKGPIIRAMPKPTGTTALPADLTGIYRFLLGADARYVVGQLIMIDGGIETLWRGEDWPRAWSISLPRFLLKLFGAQRSE